MRWFPFGSRTVLEAEAEAWQLDAWRWLLRAFGGLADLARSPLVEPTRDFFPATEADGHQRAEHVFAAVKRHARLADAPCRLVEQGERPSPQVGDVTALHFEHPHAAGTFRLEGNEAIVTYDPGSLDEPVRLIATLAHELAHYKLAGTSADIPGGEAAQEFLTDLTTVYLGFGLFGANCAFSFGQHQDATSQGWSLSQLGYLGGREWSFALAVFLALRGEVPDRLKPCLKPYLYTDLLKASRYLRQRPALVPRA